MGLGEAVIVAGIGCRSGVSADEVVAALDTALLRADLTRQEIGKLATGALKVQEAGLNEAAERLCMPLFHMTEQELASVNDRLLTTSPMSLAVTGSGSLCEAAALVAAGADSRLLSPRFVLAGVTIALAIGDHP